MLGLLSSSAIRQRGYIMPGISGAISMSATLPSLIKGAVGGYIKSQLLSIFIGWTTGYIDNWLVENGLADNYYLSWGAMSTTMTYSALSTSSIQSIAELGVSTK